VKLNIAQFAISGFVAVAGLAASASAEVVLSFGYTDLNGTYAQGGVGINGTFTANASSAGALQSSGDVTRLITPDGTSSFSAGFVGLLDSSDARFTVTVFNKTLNRAQGLGSFVLTDIDGDTITGDIDGLWIRGPQGRTFFNGNLRNVTVNDNPDGEGFFDGLFNGQAGAFSTDFIRQQPLSGAIVQLFIRTGVGFFDANFDSVSTQVAGELIPTPGALALLGLGGLVAGRRRR
jgi:hypothetical protein